MDKNLEVYEASDLRHQGSATGGSMTGSFTMSWLTTDSPHNELHIKLDVGDGGELEWISAEVETALSRAHETEKQTHQDHELKLWSATALLGSKFRDKKP